MFGLLIATQTLLLGGKYRFINKLLEGDPVALAIVGVAGALGIGGLVIRARQSRSSLDK